MKVRLTLPGGGLSVTFYQQDDCSTPGTPCPDPGGSKPVNFVIHPSGGSLCHPTDFQVAAMTSDCPTYRYTGEVTE
jgi:hypothetical protein